MVRPFRGHLTPWPCVPGWHMRTYVRMEPSTFRLAIVRPQPEDRWSALRAELAAQGAPTISMSRREGSVSFEALTGEFMLAARVAQALDAVWGHGQAWRAFSPVE